MFDLLADVQSKLSSWGMESFLACLILMKISDSETHSNSQTTFLFDYKIVQISISHPKTNKAVGAGEKWAIKILAIWT